MDTKDVLILDFKEETLHFAAIRLIARGNLEKDLVALRLASHPLFLPLEKQLFIELTEVSLIALCLTNDDPSVILEDLIQCLVFTLFEVALYLLL